jgi:hypothetical protein
VPNKSRLLPMHAWPLGVQEWHAALNLATGVTRSATWTLSELRFDSVGPSATWPPHVCICLQARWSAGDLALRIRSSSSRAKHGARAPLSCEERTLGAIAGAPPCQDLDPTVAGAAVNAKVRYEGRGVLPLVVPDDGAIGFVSLQRRRI